jgi:hypothetical protein
LCYRYTIPQYFQILKVNHCSSCDGSKWVPSKAAFFYSLAPGLGKRAGMASCNWAAAGPPSVAPGLARQSGVAAVSVNFEELDFRPTPMGVLSLRWRRHLTSGLDIYEIRLGDEFLMSSQFTSAEIGLARLGRAALDRPNLDVVVGSLGLGYTAQAVLENPNVRSMIVVDAPAEVIEWHGQGLLPLGKQLTTDPRWRRI